MDFAKIDARPLSYPGASKAFHDKWSWMVYWVGGRQFACKCTTKPKAKKPYAGRHLLPQCHPDHLPSIDINRENPLLQKVGNPIASVSRGHPL